MSFANEQLHGPEIVWQHPARHLAFKATQSGNTLPFDVTKGAKQAEAIKSPGHLLAIILPIALARFSSGYYSEHLPQVRSAEWYIC